MISTRTIAVALATLAAAAPATASAAPEPTGTGTNIQLIKNLPYPDIRSEAGENTNAGTDLEFAVLTVKGKSLKLARKQFGKRLADADKAARGIQRRYTLAGSYEDGLQIVDITDPEKAAIVKTYDCAISQGDVQVFTRADKPGRTFVAYAQDDGYDFDTKSACFTEAAALGFDTSVGGGTFIADVTDPYAPKTVSFVGIAQGSHNQTVHPSGMYLYNSNSDLITDVAPAIEVIDISSFATPKQVAELALLPVPGLGANSHDIYFTPDGKRAYSSAISQGVIIDTADPAAPRVISQIVFPAINVWHEAETVRLTDPILGERDFLIAEDEFAGATGTGQCPNGGVWVFDITGPLENAPVPVGYWNIDTVGPTEDGVGTCTAHVFQLHRKEQLMTIAFYNGGVRVVDISGLVGVALGKNGVGMKEIGSYRFADSDTWAVKAPFVDRKGFYMFGNDHRRGLDVYKFAPDGSVPSPGRWMGAGEAMRRFASLPPYRGTSDIAALCMREAARVQRAARL